LFAVAAAEAQLLQAQEIAPITAISLSEGGLSISELLMDEKRFYNKKESCCIAIGIRRWEENLYDGIRIETT